MAQTTSTLRAVWKTELILWCASMAMQMVSSNDFVTRAFCKVGTEATLQTTRTPTSIVKTLRTASNLSLTVTFKSQASFLFISAVLVS